MTVAKPLQLPKSREEVRHLQRERKALAFERAKRLPWYQGKLDKVNAAHLDQPEEWVKIPILDKETLRQFDHAEFMKLFCLAQPGEIAEYWRSGGSTGKPVFYPRTHEDVLYGKLSWGRSFEAIGIEPGSLCHMAFPIGIHPAGQVWARGAELFDVGMVWAGAGNQTPSVAQLDLIASLQPSVFIGMSSFALHLASLAEAQGIDLAAGSVDTVICSAESLTLAKREKIGKQWGAEVFDVFGMSEVGLMGAENAAHDGIMIWTDMCAIEVVDDDGNPLPEGEVGTLCCTPLYTNHATPFLRWNSGDVVSMIERSEGGGPYAALFPMIKHAHRTTGFFKIRGVNVNHTEFEDLMFRVTGVSDFQVVLETDPASSLERLAVRIEVARGHAEDGVVKDIGEQVKKTFEVTPSVVPLPLGTLAQDFSKTLKAQRFVDQRQ